MAQVNKIKHCKSYSLPVHVCKMNSTSLPVLSEQMYVTEPCVSTAGNLRISALFFANFLAPKANAIATNASTVSGIAATAREIEVIDIIITDAPRNRPIKNMIVQIMNITINNRLPKVANLFYNGVVVSSVWIIL